MNPNEYQLKSASTLSNQSAALDRMCGESTESSHIQLTHAIVGLSGEVGELASVLQKLVWYGKPMTADELRLNIKDEMGDVLWYVCEGLSSLGITLEEVMEANIRKLATRYPERYTDERAADENRDRVKESQAVFAKVYGNLGDSSCVAATKAQEMMAAITPELYHYRPTEERKVLCGYDFLHAVYTVDIKLVTCSKCREIYTSADTSMDTITTFGGSVIPSYRNLLVQDGHGFGHADEGETNAEAK